ncbi:uncharacterized protein LOC135676235 [Musa acuminata AAA Group]|uniref:uncharacterized protein LOC135676235 n=1 Tax=Musa acuminata AAA Group TaxID=214697 RepID=UPI0031D56A45
MASKQYLAKRGSFFQASPFKYGDSLPPFQPPPLIPIRLNSSVGMGNCLILQEKKVIEIMRMDGEVLRYPSPLKVQQVLNEFPGHAISDALPVIACLDPEKRMRHGQLYYLLPPKKPVAETSAGEGLVRIKLVVSKQELKEMVRKGGVSLDDMMSLLRREQQGRGGASEKERAMEWRPTLESIPEGNDLC